MGWPAALWRFYDLTGLRRFSPNEVFLLDLMDPARTRADLNDLVSKEVMLGRQLAINPASHFALTEDKLAFYRHCCEQGLPTPRVLGVWGESDQWPDGEPSANDDRAWRDLCDQIETRDLVLKPVHGVHGEGVMLLQRQADGYVSQAGERLTADDLLSRMRASNYSTWMMQERLRAHPEIAALSGNDNLQTARVVTCVDCEGNAEVVFAWLRIIGGHEAFDNFNFGTSGNYVATLDLSTARVHYALGGSSDGLGVEAVTTHPATGVRMEGFAIPHGRAVFDLARRAAQCFVPLRTIGWDIAITPDGVALIEGNVTWDPLPTFETLPDIRALA